MTNTAPAATLPRGFKAADLPTLTMDQVAAGATIAFRRLATCETAGQLNYWLDRHSAFVIEANTRGFVLVRIADQPVHGFAYADQAACYDRAVWVVS